MFYSRRRQSVKWLHVIVWGLLAGFPACPGAEPPSDADRAIRFWEARLLRDPDDYITPTKLGEAYLQKARESGDFTVYSKAAAALQQALKRNPAHHTAEGLLASTMAAQHRFREAMVLAEKVVEALPADGYGYGVLSDARLELGDLAGAEKACHKLMELDSGPFAEARMGNLQYLRGNLEQAFHHFDKAIELAKRANLPPENIAWCQVQRGSLAFRTGDFPKARAQYEAALQSLPDYYLASDHLGELCAAEGHFEEAAVRYQKLIEQLPRPEYQQALGDLYAFMGKPAEARPWHERAWSGYLAAVQQGNVHYYHHLASYYSDSQENPAEAVEWARKDLELRQSIFAYDALGWALFRNREFAQAVEPMNKALAWGTRDAHLFNHASVIYLAAGDEAKRKTHRQRATATNPRYNTFHVHR